MVGIVVMDMPSHFDSSIDGDSDDVSSLSLQAQTPLSGWFIAQRTCNNVLSKLLDVGCRLFSLNRISSCSVVAKHSHVLSCCCY